MADLNELHERLGEEFMKQIKAGDAPPSTLNACRQFLKDNGISRELVTGDTLDELEELIDPTQNPLPFPEARVS